MSLEAFGVRDLRCLADTGLVPIRKLTLLVGQNSSGKSTFLRALPLLRQSVERGRNSPILWHDKRFVDFGSLRQAANHARKEPEVTFLFRLRDKPITFDIAMTLAGGETPFVRRYEIKEDNIVFQSIFDEQGRLTEFFLNDERRVPEHSFALAGKAFLLPQLDDGDKGGVTFLPFSRDDFLADRTDRGSKLQTIKKAFGDSKAREVGSSMRCVLLADSLLADQVSNVVYLGPLRVHPERDYRIQNYSTGEVDPDGENLPMFLHSLSPTEVESFAAFTREALGFETRVKVTGIRAEIEIQEGLSKHFVNLVDVGFGYSEVLPLAAVLWSTCIRPNDPKQLDAPIVAIEQPELHLHPAAQSKLARMLVTAVSKSDGARLVIETHSESLINGVGKLVYEGVIAADDVQIVLFDKDEETGNSTVALAGYRENGTLHNWPYGFLSPVGERLVKEQPPSSRE